MSRVVTSSSVELPFGWDVSQDEEGNVFYIDHNTKTTQWEPPILPTESAKQLEFKQAVSEPDRIPDRPTTIERLTAPTPVVPKDLESPNLTQLRGSQAKMVLKYLLALQEDVKSKNEIADTLKKRLQLADAESTSLKQLLSSCTSAPSTPDGSLRIATRTPVGAGSSHFDVSHLTKQYLDSQKRVQQLKDELSFRQFKQHFNFDTTLK